tara:strand:+ start:379 stop:744 length:366 start_codon:yes stop_codon:yes gene_type:complete
MFKLPNQKHKKVSTGRFFNSKSEAAPGTPLFRKKLDEGVQAEANDDGTIFIDESVESGSTEERQILMHEMKHLTDMKIGKMKYTDDDITWNGTKYPRAEGKILFEGEWVPEGGKQFPWEQH